MAEAGKTILLTGADGLVGRALINSLLERSYIVHALSRRKERMGNRSEDPRLHYFYWDVEKGEIEDSCVHGVDAIIHLAGESIGSGRWTEKRKKAIRDSRIKSISMIYELLESQLKKSVIDTVDNIRVNRIVSASATGYYPDSGGRILFEESPPSDGFLGKICQDWEDVVRRGAERFAIRTVSMRSGVILSRAGGMYGQLRPSVSVGLGIVAGSGSQYLPWIHIRDAVEAYIYALENSHMQGAYNMVAPDQVTLGTFMHKMAKGLGKRLWLPPVPAWVLRAAMGQMSELLLASMRVSSSRLEQAGFAFRFETIDQAILDLESPA